MDCVKEIIKEKGFTQKEFAAKLGVSLPALTCALQIGNYTLATLTKYAEILGVNPFELLMTKQQRQAFHNGANPTPTNTVQLVCPCCGKPLNVTLSPAL